VRDRDARCHPILGETDTNQIHFVSGYFLEPYVVDAADAMGGIDDSVALPKRLRGCRLSAAETIAAVIGVATSTS
jgi:hypothetical protein